MENARNGDVEREQNELIIKNVLASEAKRWSSRMFSDSDRFKRITSAIDIDVFFSNRNRAKIINLPETVNKIQPCGHVVGQWHHPIHMIVQITNAIIDVSKHSHIWVNISKSQVHR